MIIQPQSVTRKNNKNKKVLKNYLALQALNCSYELHIDRNLEFSFSLKKVPCCVLFGTDLFINEINNVFTGTIQFQFPWKTK